MASKPGEKVLFVRMPAALYRKAQSKARSEDRTLSAMVREALRQYCA